MKDGDTFWKMSECYIRGSTIKYLRIPDEVIDMVKEETLMKSRPRDQKNARGGKSGGKINRKFFSYTKKLANLDYFVAKIDFKVS